MRGVLIILGILGPLLFALPLSAQAAADPLEPTRYGAAVLVGSAYDPHRIGLAMVQGQLLVDYDRIAWHAAPQALRLKFEVNAGLTTDGRQRGILAVNMLALRYLNGLRADRWTPYLEAGVGVIYTDFQVKGQGLRINFNPQAGAGVEYALVGGRALTMALRLHHISNGDTYKDNRGVNSALLMIGYLF